MVPEEEDCIIKDGNDGIITRKFECDDSNKVNLYNILRNKIKKKTILMSSPNKKYKMMKLVNLMNQRM